MFVKHFQVLVNESLIEIEYSSLAELRKDLTKRLLTIDTRGLRVTDYYGFNYKAKILHKCGTGRIKKVLQKYPTADYVIGYVRGDLETIEHERRHYRYFKDPTYRKSVEAVFRQPKYGKYLNSLRNKGYREEVLIDEAQAHYKNIIDTN